MSEEYRDPPVEVEAVSPSTLAERLAAGDPVRLLDVRNRDEFEEWHVDGPTVETTLLPYMKWLQADVTGTVADLAAEIAGEGPVTVVCGRGEASAYVAGLLVQAGFEARNLAGGMDEWAEVYRAREVEAAEGLTVVQYQRPSSGCLAYMLVADGEAAVVDPLRAFADRYVADAADRGVEITTVLDTHVHADHVSGVRELAEETGARAVMPRLALDRGVADAEAFEPLLDGSELSLGEVALRALHLPGHTTGMTAVVAGNVLLSGDSLFVESVARPDLEQGDDGAAALAAQLHESLTERLADLSEETVLAPGHYSEATTPAGDGTYSATLGEVRDRLSLLSLSREEFVARILRDMPPRPANFERIIAANLGREPLDDETAFELELGPNNCAASPSVGD